MLMILLLYLVLERVEWIFVTFTNLYPFQKFTIIIIKYNREPKILLVSHAINPYHLSRQACILDSILCLYRADVSLVWSTNIGLSMYRSPWKNIAYNFGLVFL